MSNAMSLLNRLIQTALDSDTPLSTGPFQPTGVQLAPDGGRVEGRVEHERARGKVAFDLEFASPDTDRYLVSLAVRESPGDLDPQLEPFRGVLERLQVGLTLDFSDSPNPGSER